MQEVLNGFDCITLNEMDAFKLMNRTDAKFVFNLQQLPLILKEIAPFYKCMINNKNIIRNYRTIYYDTSDLSLYTDHHNGRLNRLKVRHRTYVDTGTSFLEIKLKNNKGRTIKDRILEKNTLNVIQDSAHAFLSNKLPFSPDLLKPVVNINYGRITLVNKVTTERVTIDIDLQLKKNTQTIEFNNLVIAEVKQVKKNESKFIKVMRRNHIRERSISKYCFAIAMTHKDVKKNNFKEVLQLIKKI